jgi:hypothetical protein
MGRSAKVCGRGGAKHQDAGRHSRRPFHPLTNSAVARPRRSATSRRRQQHPRVRQQHPCVRWLAGANNIHNMPLFGSPASARRLHCFILWPLLKFCQAPSLLAWSVLRLFGCWWCTNGYTDRPCSDYTFFYKSSATMFLR